jgi:hypothetical protein
MHSPEKPVPTMMMRCRGAVVGPVGCGEFREEFGGVAVMVVVEAVLDM